MNVSEGEALKPIKVNGCAKARAKARRGISTVQVVSEGEALKPNKVNGWAKARRGISTV